MTITDQHIGAALLALSLGAAALRVAWLTLTPIYAQYRRERRLRGLNQ